MEVSFSPPKKARGLFGRGLLCPCLEGFWAGMPGVPESGCLLLPGSSHRGPIRLSRVWGSPSSCRRWLCWRVPPLGSQHARVGRAIQARIGLKHLPQIFLQPLLENSQSRGAQHPSWQLIAPLDDSVKSFFLISTRNLSAYHLCLLPKSAFHVSLLLRALASAAHQDSSLPSSE